jgi:hypothetical protein
MATFAKSSTSKHYFIFDRVIEHKLNPGSPYISGDDGPENALQTPLRARPSSTPALAPHVPFEHDPSISYMLDNVVEGGMSTLVCSGPQSESSVECCVRRLFALASDRHELCGGRSDDPVRMSICCVDVVDDMEVVDLLDTGSVNSYRVRVFYLLGLE